MPFAFEALRNRNGVEGYTPSTPFPLLLQPKTHEADAAFIPILRMDSLMLFTALRLWRFKLARLSLGSP